MRNKQIKTLVLLSLALALLFPAAQRRDDDCFTVLVGKKASADGSVMIGHNEDDRNDIIVNLRKIQPHDYGAPQAEFKGAKNGLIHTTVLAFEQAAEADYGPMVGTLRQKLFPIEKAFLENRPKFEVDFTALYAKEEKKAPEMLIAYVVTAFDRAAGVYKKLPANQPEP